MNSVIYKMFSQFYFYMLIVGMRYLDEIKQILHHENGKSANNLFIRS